MKECWSIMGQNTMTTKSSCNTELNKTDHGWGNTSYGKMIIPSIGDSIYEWELKIKHKLYLAMYIGIHRVVESLNTSESFVDDNINIGYAWIGNK